MRAPVFLFSRWLVGWVLGWVGVMSPVAATPLVLQDAAVVVTVNGHSSRSNTQLPYHWDQQHKGQRGLARFELNFDLPDTTTVPHGVYIPRLGNAFEVWLNGHLVQRKGDLAQFDTSDYAKVPRYVPLDATLLRRHNLLEVRIRADMGRKAGLAPLVFGPDEEVYPLYYQSYRARGTGSLVVTVISVLIALVALALWATQVDTLADGRRQRDPVYWIAGVAELFWAFRVGDTMVESPPLPWAGWGTMVVVSLGLWAIGMALVGVFLAGWEKRPTARWFFIWLGVLLCGSVVCGVAALVGGHAWALSAWYVAAFSTFLPFVAVFVWKATRHSSTTHRLMALVMLVNVLVGARDWYALRISLVYGANSYQRFSALLFGVVLGYMVIQRFRHASARARDLTANLESRIAQKEAELGQTYARVEQLAREQERVKERSRILRDMHDGVGSHISVAMRQLQSGSATEGQVLQTLRESLDHLKLSIDAMNMPPGDITALLANLRYRLEPRLKAAQIDLQWEVDGVEPFARLDDNAMRQLQFLVYEALSNVLQHAHASTVHIALAQTTQGVRLRVADNGCGFAHPPDPSLTRRGLAAMQERAAALGGTLAVHSTPGNTVVELLLARLSS